jgi:hypothetical protein
MAKSDGLRCPMNPDDFFHWIAKHGLMTIGARPEDYIRAKEISWAAYLRGRSDQKKIQKKKANLPRSVSA